MARLLDGRTGGVMGRRGRQAAVKDEWRDIPGGALLEREARDQQATVFWQHDAAEQPWSWVAGYGPAGLEGGGSGRAESKGAAQEAAECWLAEHRPRRDHTGVTRYENEVVPPARAKNEWEGIPLASAPVQWAWGDFSDKAVENEDEDEDVEDEDLEDEDVEDAQWVPPPPRAYRQFRFARYAREGGAICYFAMKFEFIMGLGDLSRWGRDEINTLKTHAQVHFVVGEEVFELGPLGSFTWSDWLGRRPTHFEAHLRFGDSPFVPALLQAARAVSPSAAAFSVDGSAIYLPASRPVEIRIVSRELQQTDSMLSRCSLYYNAALPA